MLSFLLPSVLYRKLSYLCTTPLLRWSATLQQSLSSLLMHLSSSDLHLLQRGKKHQMSIAVWDGDTCLRSLRQDSSSQVSLVKFYYIFLKVSDTYLSLHFSISGESNYPHLKTWWNITWIRFTNWNSQDQITLNKGNLWHAEKVWEPLSNSHSQNSEWVIVSTQGSHPWHAEVLPLWEAKFKVEFTLLTAQMLLS